MAAKQPAIEALRAAPGRKKLSVIVTTFNEEINVAECLESVLWADEIVLVDSFSTDRTVEIARTFPITVLQRQYFGSAAQKNWALDRVQHEWVLIIDADERVPEALAVRRTVQATAVQDFRQVLRLIEQENAGHPEAAP